MFCRLIWVFNEIQARPYIERLCPQMYEALHVRQKSIYHRLDHFRVHEFLRV